MHDRALNHPLKTKGGLRVDLLSPGYNGGVFPYELGQILAKVIKKCSFYLFILFLIFVLVVLYLIFICFLFFFFVFFIFILLFFLCGIF